jgi:8-hydroxy-5-deazaflavin:NADPH oxidoreductase
MPSVSILGTGAMGSAIADLARRAGWSVELLGRADAETPLTGDLVVLAVPYAAVPDVLASRRGQLDGRVIVDITNPVSAPFDKLDVPGDSSAAAEIAAALPRARVVKAFNTTYAGHLTSGRTGDQPTAVLVAGDDAEAKAHVVDLVTRGGLRAIDAGGLDRARELEALCFLQLSLAAREQIPWTGGFAVA